MSASRWDSLPAPVPDAVFKLDALAKAAPSPKINLVIGAYRDEEGKPRVLEVVKKAEMYLAKEAGKKYNKEYLPIDGMPEFRAAASELLFGREYYNRLKGRIGAVQSLSGTGAIRILAEFYKVACPNKTQTPVYFSNPTWANHKPIFKDAGFMNLNDYRYYDSATCLVSIEPMLEDIRNAPNGSIFVLHICAHNPTGADPTPEQWKRIAKVMKEKSHFACFDSAYQGYASGNLMRDSMPARLFVDEGLEFTVGQSFAKNMGLYCERIGLASAVCKNSEAAIKANGLMKTIVRCMYSNPPAHGARIAHLVLTDPQLRPQWEQEVKHMSMRIKTMRTVLRSELERLGAKPPGKSWEHITKQIGMFSYLGLTKEQVAALQKRRVFLLPSSRISVAGLIESTAKDLAKHIKEVVEEIPYNTSKM